jgi:hypothetical protein
MATRIETSAGPVWPARAWDFLLAGRPLRALVVVWLTTAGHTMNFREMGAAFGWVSIEAFSLHTAYLFSIGLMLLACPHLGRRFSCRGLAQAGTAAFMAGGLINGLVAHAPLEVYQAARVLAGAGSGLVISFAPRLFDPRWRVPAIWAAILAPAAGPAFVGATSVMFGQSAWQGGFLAQGVFALFALALLLSMAEAPDVPPRAPHGSLTYLPWLILAVSGLWYVLHWGQLHGWLESFDIVTVTALGTAALALALWLAWPDIDFVALRENWGRLLLFAYAGLILFYYVPQINIYGGLLVNLNVWQRSWIVWSLLLGVAASLGLVELIRLRWALTPGLPGAILGLLFIAGGLAYSWRQTLDWPFWDIRNQLDLNWFAAPQERAYNPGRFLVGFGIGLLMMALESLASRDPSREEKVRPFLVVAQFLGGGLGAALLVNYLLIGHPIQYSYSAEREYIQAEEIAQRRALLRTELARAGSADPEREAEVLLYRAVNFEADNLVFASMYGTFTISALVMAGLAAGLLLWGWARPPPATPA